MSTKRYGMVIDIECCAGCMSCTVSCKSEHEVPLGVFRTKVEDVETGEYPSVTRTFVPVMCNHCSEAPCLTACPTNSIIINENGIVDIIEETCTGVGKCVTACPYDAIYLHPQTNIASKCDFCKQRLDDGQQPSCVESCPTEAFIFGDLNDKESPIYQFIKNNEVSNLKVELGTKPNIYYYQLNKEVEEELKGVNKKGRRGM
ncbi:4Fe-4S dicluster domain-containing protein [Anaerobacillus sp. MEB173]|uniref:4Fe-4S dicluster domain-containing protein n=1 Tax=Anaerobacillus sp. MEB173 TaxID=3383345 RepID=UPI003F92156C